MAENEPISQEMIKVQTDLARHGWILRHPKRPDQFDPSAQNPEAYGWKKVDKLYYLTFCALSDFPGSSEPGHFEDQDHFNKAVTKAESLIGTMPT